MQTPGYTKALLQGKCPQCHTGDIFKYPISGHLWKFNHMNMECPHCKVRLEPEPGFYQGAMYVGYGFTMICIILVSTVLYATSYAHASEWLYIGVIVMLLVLFIPLNYRYSRIIYLYMFGGIKFDPDYAR
jgi:uncharacterized protein (DUF983 family)